MLIRYGIELDEIKNVILDCPGVTSAEVIVHNTDNQDMARKQIGAYLILTNHASLDMIRSRASSILPEYMMPSSFTLLSELPITSNGKLDTNELYNQKQRQLNTPSTEKKMTATS